MPEEMDSLVGYIKLMGFEEVARQLNGFSAQMRSSAETAKTTLGEQERAFKSSNESISSGLGSISGKLKGLFAAAGITVGIAATISALKGATAAALEFDQQMDKVGSRLSGAEFGKLGELGAGVEKMSVRFGEGTQGLTDGLTEIIDAGIPASKSLGVLSDSIILAKGHMAESASVISSVTSILRGFKIEAEDSGHVADVLATTAERGRGPMEGLAGTIGSLSPYARQAKFSLEETAAAVSTLTREGVPLEKTGMVLRTMFINIAEAQDKGIIKSTTLAGAISELSKMQEKDREAIVGSGKLRSEYNILLQQSAGYAEDLAAATEQSGLAQEKWNRISGDASQKMGMLKEASLGFTRTVGAGIADLLDKSGLLDGMTQGFIDLAKAIKGLSFSGSVSNLKNDIESIIGSYEKQQGELSGLIAKHDQLTKALKEGKPGSQEYVSVQKELYGVIEDIVAIVPEARDDISEYGSSFGASIEKVQGFTAAQREYYQLQLQIKRNEAELLVIQGRETAAKAGADLEKARRELDAWQSAIRDIQANKGQSIFGDVISQETIDKFSGLQGGLTRMNDLFRSSGANLAEFQKNEDGARQAVLAAQVAVDKQTAAQRMLDGITAQLADKTSFWGQAVGILPGIMDRAAASIKTTENATQKLITAEEKHLEILGSVDWSDYYGRQERLSGKTTLQIIDDIDRLMAEYEKEGATQSKAYKDLADLRVEYAEKGIEEQIKAEQDAAQRITDIWDGVNEDVKSSMSDALGDMLTGDSDFDDAIKSMGDRIKESFAHGFADALVEKSGFDLAFKNNMLDLGGFASSIFGGGAGGGGGLFGTLSSGFSSLTDLLGITGGAAAATAGDMAGLTEGIAGVGETATVTGNTITYTGESMLAFPAAGSAAAEGMTTVTGAAGQTTGALNATAGAATKAAPALTKAGSGLAGLNLALPATGVYLAAITGQFGETAQKISLVGTEAAALTVALGPLGALVGGVAGTLAHFGHSVFGVGGQHITFEEQFSGYLKDLQEGTKTQEEVFRQLYLRTTNYANDFWGTQSDLLKQSYAERLAYYNKFAELKDSTGASLFSEEQLNKLKDALQLFDTVEERAAAAQRTASEVAREVFTTKVWETFKEVPYLLDEVGQVGPVFQQAFEEAQASGEDFTEVFKRKLMELPGISQQALDLILEAFGQTTSEISDEIETAAGGYRDMWAAAAEGISDAGSSADEFFNNVQNVSGMWLKGWDIDIHEALMQIPGMTAEVKDALMEELRGLKKSGATDFQIAESFKESVTSALNDPSLRKEVDGVSEMLRNAFSGIEAEPMELGRLFDTTGLKAFVKQLSTVKGGWNGIIDSVQEFRAELEASGQTAESAGDDIYKHLRDSLSEIPGITQEMVQTMERLIRSGDWQVLVDVSERGLDDVLHSLKGIPSKINVGVTASESRGVSPGAVLEGLVNRLLQMASPPSVGGSFTPTISAAASGSLAALASSGSASGRGDKHYHITLTIPGGEFGDRQFWDNVVRNKIQPALDAIEARG